jgi:hypothetical protein
MANVGLYLPTVSARAANSHISRADNVFAPAFRAFLLGLKKTELKKTEHAATSFPLNYLYKLAGRLPVLHTVH